MPKTVHYKFPDLELTKRRALKDVRQYMGEDMYFDLIQIMRKCRVEERDEILFSLEILAGVSGYPAEVFVDTFLGVK